eukprot:scaffold46395_cov74-Phaeocystis_antarctica.AAC.2
MDNDVRKPWKCPPPIALAGAEDNAILLPQADSALLVRVRRRHICEADTLTRLHLEQMRLLETVCMPELGGSANAIGVLFSPSSHGALAADEPAILQR